MAYTKASSGEETPSPRPVTASGRYELLMQERSPYLTRGRKCSELTIPSLLPPEGSTSATTLYQPYQSTGADGVNNLGAKLLLALFPSGTPFFRLTIDDFVLEDLARKVQGQDARGEFEAALGKIERSVVNRMEARGNRKVNFEALLHLIVAGNGLLYVDKMGGEKFFPLDRYVVSRDLDDNVIEIVVKECVAKEALAPEIREVVDRHSKPAQAKADGKGEPEQVEVYTWVQRQKNESWKVQQEVCGEIIPTSRGSYPKDKSAWLPLRWSKVAGESYGRGRCEEYLGDLQSLENLTKAIVEFAVAASKIIVLVNEAGVTSKEEVARARSGAVLDGDAKDITILMLEKSQDFNVAKSVADETKARLERAFLMASSIQRQAERVTAEEIRLMAGELEQGLGGVYSILAEEFQRPLVTRIMHQMSTQKGSKVPRLPDNTVTPQIVTGLDGLGRNTDMQRLDALIDKVGQTFGPEALAQYVNVGAFMKRRANALGIDLTGLVRSEEEIQQQQQQAQMQSMAEKLGPQAISAMSDQALANKQVAAEAPADPTQA